MTLSSHRSVASIELRVRITLVYARHTAGKRLSSSSSSHRTFPPDATSGIASSRLRLRPHRLLSVLGLTAPAMCCRRRRCPSSPGFMGSIYVDDVPELRSYTSTSANIQSAMSMCIRPTSPVCSQSSTYSLPCLWLSRAFDGLSLSSFAPHSTARHVFPIS